MTANPDAAMDDERPEDTSRSSPDSPPYERIEELGSGGIGTVYRGRQTRLDRDVAIKEINNLFDIFADLKREDIVERFTEIVRQQASLSHPNIIQIFDFISEAEYPYVITEYAPNGSLRRLIDDEEGRSLELALKYFVQILHGLNAAHQRDVVHGSIKPENVLLDPAGNAHLSDFGISTLVDLSDTSDQVYVGVGSVEYMPPEQIQNPTDATVESDIYALGIMFYEMLTGKVPGRRSPMPSSFYPEIPRALDDIFDRMSMDMAEDRYESIDDILVDFYEADAIVELLDRETGVTFLRDPIEHGEARFVEGQKAEPVEPDEARGTEPPAPSEPNSTTEPDGDEIHESEASSESRDASSETSGDDDEEMSRESTEEESQDASTQSEGPSSASGDAETVPEEVEQTAAEDDEVLEKLDEYGELFEEES